MSQPDLSPEERVEQALTAMGYPRDHGWHDVHKRLWIPILREVEAIAEQRGRLQGLDEILGLAKLVDSQWWVDQIEGRIRELKNTQSKSSENIVFGPGEMPEEEIKRRAEHLTDDLLGFTEWFNSFEGSEHPTKAQLAAAYYAGYRAKNRVTDDSKAD